MKKRIYLDHAASTPVDPRVEHAMRPYFLRAFGNPGSLHSFGQEAIAAVDASRETLARLIGADFHEVVFTGSATEANNLALRGAIAAWRDDPRHGGIQPRIIVSVVEHESVLETVRDLARKGEAEAVFVPVDKEGRIDPRRVADVIGTDGRTAIVSLMQANNEIGTIQPIAAIAAIVRKARGNDPWPLFHTDAVQAFHVLDCDVRILGVDMMTLSAHKISGPKGVGALFVCDGGSPVPLPPMITGGGQEFGRRSGTENVPLIVGFAKAAALAAAARKKEAKRLAALRDYCIKGIKKTLKDTEVNGPSSSAAVAPHILNVYFPEKSAEDIVVGLDLAGIGVSAGSACRARAVEPSHVIRALGGFSESEAIARARSSIRISFGRATTKAEVDRFLAAVKLF